MRWNKEIFLSDNYCVMDFEVTNLDKGDYTNKDNSVVCCTVKARDETYFLKGNEFEIGRDLDDLLSSYYFVVAHNAKFELGWIQRCGIDTTNQLMYCTQLGEYTIAGNRKVPLGLNKTLERYGIKSKDHLVGSMIASGICPSEIPTEWLRRYNIIDVERTTELFKKQRIILRENKLLGVQLTRCLLINALVDIEFKGMYLDKTSVYKEYDITQSKINELEAKILEFANEETEDPL